jgi:alkylation response protein AidB-like acyl-CoA dehydrogenase
VDDAEARGSGSNDRDVREERMATTQTPVSSPAITSKSAGLIERARELGPIIREHSSETETNRRLAKPVLDALVKAGFTRLFTPRSLGGLEVDPVTCAHVVEEVALHDSAAGWALQSPNVNAWWASRLPDESVEEIYRDDPGRMMAAAIHPPLQATETRDGLRVSGRAHLASMIHDCDWILVGAFIMDDGKPRMTEHGPAMVAVIVPTAEVEVLDTWFALGMRGTDSNDVAFKDVLVPAKHSFPFAPQFTPGRHFQGPLYRYPAVPIIAVFSSAVQLATARKAIDTTKALAMKKTPFGLVKSLGERGTTQAALADAEAVLRSARAYFHDTLAEGWARTVAGNVATLEERADILLACIHAVRSSARVTDAMHAQGGSSGIYAVNPLERYFRDAHTLRQHGVVSENKLEAVGQVFLGLPPDFPFLAF